MSKNINQIYAANPSSTVPDAALFYLGLSGSIDSAIVKQDFFNQISTDIGKVGADIASASTINLESATGNIVNVTGTTTINAVTLSEGHSRWVRFTGALTLTNGVSLSLPTSSNITTSSGDYALFIGYSGGVVRVSSYLKKDGTPLADNFLGTVTTVSVTTGNGISATVSNPTTTPAIQFDPVQMVHGADIASASTINLESATGQIVDVTGTTTINTITLSEGHGRIVRFTGALTLTNGSSLILPTSANIQTAAGDYAYFIGYAAGIVRLENYQRFSGKPLVDNFSGTVTTVSVTSGNGVSATVNNPTTTPAIQFDPVQMVHGADIASASTVNLETATGQIIDITGTTTINTVTLSEGHERTVRFTGSLALTNSSSLVLPTGQDITTTAGDYAKFIGYAAGVVRVSFYQKSDGSYLSNGAVLTANTGSAITISDVTKCAVLTMNSATPTITFTPSLPNISHSIFITLVQDGSGNRAPTFSGVIYLDNFIPQITQGASAITCINLVWNGSSWLLVQVGGISLPSTFSWNTVSGTSVTMSQDNAYRGTNAAGATYSLPTTSDVNTLLEVATVNALITSSIAQQSGQSITMNGVTTTASTGHGLRTTDAAAWIKLICTNANTDFQVIGSQGMWVTY